MPRALIVFAVVALGLAAAPAVAGPLQDGEAALARGDYAQAAPLLREAAKAGDPKAQFSLAIALMGQGDGAGRREGLALMTRLAEQGLAVAQYALGQAYAEGLWGERDTKLGLKWLTRAAQQDGEEGADRAQLALGRLYEGGRGVRANRAQAWKWLARAAAGLEASAAKGDLGAQLTLAGLYRTGEGVNQDKARAQQLTDGVFAAYQTRADQGEAEAQLRLARLFRSGRLGIPQGQRDRIAAGWLRRAADQGQATAQVELGKLYGVGPMARMFSSAPQLKEDELEGYFWISLAIRSLPPARAALLEDIAARGEAELSPDQKASLDRRLAAWRPVAETPNPDGSPIVPTPAQQAEAARLQTAWDPTPDQVAGWRKAAEAYDVVLGSPDAKRTVVVYLSAVSPHSARFLSEILPGLRTKYVDTGQVRFVFREVLTPPQGAAADGFLIARCAGPDRYLAALAAVAGSLSSLTDPDDDKAWLEASARAAGLTDTQTSACLVDRASRQALYDRDYFFQRFESVSQAPELVIDGRFVRGEATLARIDAAIFRSLNPPPPDAPHSFAVRLVVGEDADDPSKAPPTPGAVRLSQVAGPDLWVVGPDILTAEMMADVATSRNDMTGMPVVTFTLSEEGRRRFAAFTRKHVGERFAIVVDGVIVSAPRVMGPIEGGSGEINGPTSPEEAIDLAAAIRKARTPLKP